MLDLNFPQSSNVRQRLRIQKHPCTGADSLQAFCTLPPVAPRASDSEQGATANKLDALDSAPAPSPPTAGSGVVVSAQGSHVVAGPDRSSSTHFSSGREVETVGGPAMFHGTQTLLLACPCGTLYRCRRTRSRSAEHGGEARDCEFAGRLPS